MIRPATIEDLDNLVRLENLCFDTDRISRRSFRYLITKGNAAILVEEEDSTLRGDVVILFNNGISLARLYSLAVAKEYRGTGIGIQLVKAAEKVANEHDCIYMRLEVRKDNTPSINLFKKAGYKQFGVLMDYYEDHMDALRFEKSLAPQLNLDMVRVPFYEQTLEFTCGPSAIMYRLALTTLNRFLSCLCCTVAAVML